MLRILQPQPCVSARSLSPQDIAIAKMVELMRQHVEQEPATLFVVGSYHIGKERAYIGPARALGWRIYCPPAKLRVSSVGCWLVHMNGLAMSLQLTS